MRFGKAEFFLGKTYRTPGCPKSHVTERALFLIRLVNWSEEIHILPTATTLMKESSLYFDIRNFVVSEQSISESELSREEKK